MRKPAVLILMALMLTGCGNIQLDKITGLIEKNNQIIERNTQAVLASLEKHHTQNSWGKNNNEKFRSYRNRYCYRLNRNLPWLKKSRLKPKNYYDPLV
ncbi:hypothetical protein ATZ36_13755 [Candidatus Endomicrobiellum trichonymphae]|uniref:Lipoprotein n=1 Tax=Endomicrobium trichonymphae TaxID=1408204 RepID=A0A1E5IMA6_ENDTX|nr:hypothetical protein ATZ36_13755 [Candidatus Endomicrobium trichonymphae]